LGSSSKAIQAIVNVDRVKLCVVGFSGRIKSGKTTISEAVAEALQWPRASFGDYVRSVAARRGLDPGSRPVLQDVGESLIAEGWPEFCQAVLGTVNWEPGDSLVVDGIRHAEVVDQLKAMVGPFRLYLFHVQVDEEIRAERVRRSEHEQLRDAEAHSTEADVKAVLPSMADLVVDGANPFNLIVEEILAFLDKS
jgi:cytidylate kinase